MMKTTRKAAKKATANLIWITVAVVVTALFYLYNQFGGSPVNVPADDVFVSADGALSVHFIDVGQGDAALVVAPDGSTMLIDAGPNGAEDELSGYIDALGIKRFTYVVFTHPHEDHIGGGDMIMREYDVGTVIMPSAVSTTATFERLVDAIDASGAQVICANVVCGKSYTLGSDTGAANFTILAPGVKEYDDLNNSSVVLQLDYGASSFLFTGDAEKESERDQLAAFGAAALRCDVLKVGHHGSSTSTTQEYLDAVSPKAAVISCAKINDYGHPHAETLEKLQNAGAEIYITGDLGTVVFRCDGTNIEAVIK
jgi:competence protein ComEC